MYVVDVCRVLRRCRVNSKISYNNISGKVLSRTALEDDDCPVEVIVGEDFLRVVCKVAAECEKPFCPWGCKLNKYKRVVCPKCEWWFITCIGEKPYECPRCHHKFE